MIAELLADTFDQSHPCYTRIDKIHNTLCLTAHEDRPKAGPKTPTEAFNSPPSPPCNARVKPLHTRVCFALVATGVWIDTRVASASTAGREHVSSE